MKHSAAIGLIVLVALSLGLSRAEERKLPTIGQIWFTNPSLAKPFDEAFRDGLRTLGYVDGKNITILARYAQGNDAQSTVLVRELVGLRVDVMVVNAKAVRAAMQATHTIPIVCPSIGDPLKEGLVKSLAHPGGNFTAISAQAWETDSERLELARDALPNLRHVGLLFDANFSSDVTGAGQLREFAHSQAITVRMLGVRNLDEIRDALSDIDKSDQALIVFDSPLMFLHREVIMRLVAHRVPVISEARGWAEAGALIAYAPDPMEMWRRSASYVDKILKGAKAGDLPIEQANKLDLVVNLRTAKDFGITIPQSILLRANDVIRR